MYFIILSEQKEKTTCNTALKINIWQKPSVTYRGAILCLYDKARSHSETLGVQKQEDENSYNF